MRDKQTLTLIIGFLILLTSCDLINPDEQAPAYVTINKIDFDAGYKHGTDSSEIKDVWVYLDNDLVGAFELPATIPILAEGTQTLGVYPGVILNGISGTRALNPFMESFQFDIDFSSETNINLNQAYSLKSTYKQAVNFAWNEDVGQEGFEEAGISIDSIGSSSVGIRKTKDVVYEGTYSGWIHLDSAHTSFLGASIQDFDVITGNRPVFLEIHIKNPDHVLEVGFYENFSASSVVKSPYMYINSGEEWKKMYINLTPHMPSMASAKSFKIYFESYLREDREVGDIYIDNIKLIYL